MIMILFWLITSVSSLRLDKMASTRHMLILSLFMIVLWRNVTGVTRFPLISSDDQKTDANESFFVNPIGATKQLFHEEKTRKRRYEKEILEEVVFCTVFCYFYVYKLKINTLN